MKILLKSGVAVKISLILLYLQGTLCLRGVYLLLPEAMERGTKVEMKCCYDLENEILYTVKWYRGDREFCRYSPRDIPPLKIFPIPGIEVDKDASDAHRLTIKATTRIANGWFTCEVSADEPSFQTALVRGHMYVVDFPQPQPEVLGLKLYYRVGSNLKVECTSLNSIPAANISFFINSQRAHKEHVWHRVDPTNSSTWNAYGTLQFVVQKHHFIGGKMKIRCNVNIYNVYFRSNELCALEERIPTTPESVTEITRVFIRRKPINPIHRVAETNNSAGNIHGTVLSIFLITLRYMAYLFNVN